jgi:hypothetical protein
MNAVLKPRQTKSVIYKEVEFDLSEFDNDDLIAELAKRGVESSPGIGDLFNAMKFGNHKVALELLRIYLMDVTGRVLP